MSQEPRPFAPGERKHSVRASPPTWLLGLLGRSGSGSSQRFWVDACPEWVGVFSPRRVLATMDGVIIVPDANTFHNDPAMAKRNFRVLLGQHQREHLELIIPDVVLREVGKIYRQKLETAAHSLEGETRKLRELRIDQPDPAIPAVEEKTKHFLEWLRADLAARGIKTPGLPHVSVSDLFEDSVAERRPFQAAGRGFRDALIWRNVLALAEDDEVCLVTKNYTDFAESKKDRTALHPDLREDLRSRGLDEHRVVLFESLEDLITERVPRADEIDRALQLTEKEGPPRDGLFEEATSALQELELDPGDDVTVIGESEAQIENVSVADARVIDLEVVDAWPTDADNVISLELRVHAELSFTFTADDHGAEWLASEGHDIELQVIEETFAQYTTLARHCVVTYWVELDPNEELIGPFEKVVAADDTALAERLPTG